MEKSKNTYKQAKRNAQIGSAGGSNIGGLVVAGGALAVASLVAAVAAFAVHRGKKRGGNETSSRRQKKEDQTDRGLHFNLQNSPPTFDCNPRCASDESMNMVATQIDSCELVWSQNLILEENPASTINCRNEFCSSEYDQEILLTDDSKQDSIKSCKHHSGIEEFSLSMLDNIKNDSGEELLLMEVIEVTEEEIEMNAVKRTSLMHSIEEEEEEEKKEEGNDEKDEDVVVVEETKAEFSLVEGIEVIKEEETINSVEVSAEKISSMLSVEEEQEEEGNDEKDEEVVVVEETKAEFSLVEGIEVIKKEETIDSVEVSAEKISSMLSVEEEQEEEGNDEKNEEVVVVEETNEFFLAERIEVIKEEETIDSVEVSAEKSSSMLSVEEEEEEEKEKESSLIKRIEVWNEEEAIDNASKMSAEITTMLSVIEKEDENDSNEEDGNKEFAIEKEEGNSEGTESSSAGSNAEEIWPMESVEELSQELKDNLQHSVAKIIEEQQTTISEECTHLYNGKIDMLGNRRNDHHTTKKEETLESIGLTDQPMWLTKWRVWARHVLILALMVLLLFAHRNGLSLDLVIGRAAGHNL